MLNRSCFQLILQRAISPILENTDSKQFEGRSFSMRSFAVKCVDSLPDRCLEVVELDIDEIEDHLSKINFTDVPTVKMMAAGFKCPISALPFGALKSDWSRLLLLQEAQPDGSIIKRKLIRLLRFLVIAYYQMEESFDVIKPDTQAHLQ